MVFPGKSCLHSHRFFRFHAAKQNKAGLAPTSFYQQSGKSINHANQGSDKLANPVAKRQHTFFSCSSLVQFACFSCNTLILLRTPLVQLVALVVGSQKRLSLFQSLPVEQIQIYITPY